VAYKLLALDVDGTLLRRDGTVHPADRAAIERLRRSGVPVTIATGRLYSGSCAVARDVGLSGPIACIDGSHIVHLDDDSDLYKRSIAGQDATMLRSVLEENRLATFLFAQDSIVHDEHGAAFAPYVQTWSPRIDQVERVTAHPYWEHEHGVMAAVSVGPEEVIRIAAEQLHERLQAAVLAVTFPVTRLGGTFAMVARARGPTKGTAIHWLAAHYGCTAADVVAVGDWLNDLPMFEAAGRSFAMAQAPEPVKAAATDQLEADGHAGGGVAEAIRRAWSM
jgi:Cof subfamily protein (haloacid dehalogenase superfamily)